MTSLQLRLQEIIRMTDPYSFTIFPVYYEEQGEDGPYTALKYCVEASDALGHTWVHFKTFKNLVECDILLHRIVAGRPEGWNPDTNESWTRGRLIYGSQAFQKEGGEAELQKTDVEAEYGPGSYHPGHPGWLA